MPRAQPHHAADDHIWSVEGRFQHPVHSPRGGVQGLLITSAGLTRPCTA
ncbi:hypothetical protein [Pseudorhodoferax aquiterrae]|nr:hypothetical protein [Pseudorhodoferax aquiterrae]